jgi:TPR repeat protein
MFAIVGILLGLGMVAGLASPAFAQIPDQQALSSVKEWADSICVSVPLQQNKTVAGANAKVDLGLIAKLLSLGGLGGSVGADYQKEVSAGVLQKDLATAIQNSNNCRLEVLRLLLGQTRGDANVAKVLPQRNLSPVAAATAVPAPTRGTGSLTRDDREAARLYKLAADQGYASAQASLGVFYEQGRGGLPKNDREAARLYRLAADQGHATAQANLGLLYWQGRGGLPRDEIAAARLYKLAADQGSATGQVSLGFCYSQGRGGLPKDEREAARLYRLAADRGNARALNNLGFYYSGGRGGLRKDEREAARLYKLAADKGDAQAQMNLGIFYEQGRGGLPKDEREAARLYKLAADQGNASAQARLARLFAR